jgi:DNA polymerase alpha-associated DNA helicase A
LAVSRYIVLTPLYRAGSRQLFDTNFDVLIIDEAAQALEAVCWIPIMKNAKKLMLAGDHLQLPPTIKSSDSDLPDKLKKDKKASPKTLEVTLFDRLLSMYGGKVKTLLNVQYRMHEKVGRQALDCSGNMADRSMQIMLFPSRELYDSKLTAHESVSARLLSDLKGSEGKPLGEGTEDDGLLTEPVIFYDTAGSAMYERAEDSDSDSSVRRTVDGESKSNENEATIVMSFISQLGEAGVQKENIAVISPYNAQVALVQSLLREKYPPDALAEGPAAHGTAIECGSVDGFQGREKDVIILTLVRSNDKKEVGFLSEKRRLNGK